MAKTTAVEVLKRAAELKEAKSKDYQGGTWEESDYFPYGDLSYMHMIHTKYLRMRNIVEGDQQVNFEALEDTLMDMAVYAAMFAAKVINDKEGFVMPRSERMNYRHKRRRHWLDYIQKKRGCKRCGYSEDVRALQWAHIDPAYKSRKSKTSDWMSPGQMTFVSLKRFIQHLRLFKVLCANCHQIETHEDKLFIINKKENV